MNCRSIPCSFFESNEIGRKSVKIRPINKMNYCSVSCSVDYVNKAADKLEREQDKTILFIQPLTTYSHTIQKEIRSCLQVS